MDAKTYGRVMSNELEQCFEFYTAVVVLGKMILITESVSLLNMALSTNHFPTALGETCTKTYQDVQISNTVITSVCDTRHAQSGRRP